MTSKLVSALPLAALLLACAHDRAHESARGERTTTAQRGTQAEVPADTRSSAERTDVAQQTGEMMRDGGASAGGEPDNSDVNERDRNGSGVTAMDQGNDERDVNLTQRIRKAVIADDSLSFTAKNAKIVARDGHVTLRGPVKTAAEKDALYRAAVSAAGAGHVTNELEVDQD